MAGTTICTPCCTTTQVTNVPGAAGADGSNGTNGINAFTLVNGAGFSVPGSVGGTVDIPVDDSSWVVIGQVVVVDGPASFVVTAVPDINTIRGLWQNYSGDVAAATVISAGAKVGPGGRQNPVPRVISTAVDYTIGDNDDVIQVTVDGKTITLPTAVGINGKRFTVIQTAVFAAGTTINPDGAETINGAASKNLGAQYKYKTMVSNGADWFIIADN